ncbi:MAG: hypothetical protein ACRCYY_07415 [Trueperaceae bacterium]
MKKIGLLRSLIHDWLYDQLAHFTLRLAITNGSSLRASAKGQSKMYWIYG